MIKEKSIEGKTICVVGLGYVGLPKLFSFAKTFTKLLTPFLLRKKKCFFGKAFFSKERFAIKALNDVGKVIKSSKILIMGMTYKGNVADTRESPVKEMIKGLKEFGVEVLGYDPLLKREELEEFDVEVVERLEGLKVDCVVIAAVHEVFKKMSLDLLKEIMTEKPVLIDVRGFFDKEEALEEGFYYKRL